MEFRLVYKGRLPSESRADSRTKEKHAIRKVFHPQLRELWKQQPDLLELSQQRFFIHTTPSNLVSHPGPDVKEIIQVPHGDTRQDAKTWLEHIADDHQRCGGRFVPLVRNSGGFTCALDILFLRRDNPG